MGGFVILSEKNEAQVHVLTHESLRHNKWNVVWTNSIYFEFFEFLKKMITCAFYNRIIYLAFYIVNFPF